jgi:hypothetical protein
MFFRIAGDAEWQIVVGQRGHFRHLFRQSKKLPDETLQIVKHLSWKVIGLGHYTTFYYILISG